MYFVTATHRSQIVESVFSGDLVGELAGVWVSGLPLDQNVELVGNDLFGACAGDPGAKGGQDADEAEETRAIAIKVLSDVAKLPCWELSLNHRS